MPGCSEGSAVQETDSYFDGAGCVDYASQRTAVVVSAVVDADVLTAELPIVDAFRSRYSEEWACHGEVSLPCPEFVDFDPTFY